MIKGKRQARAWLFERAAHLLEEDREESGGMTEAEERLVAGEVSHVTAKIRAAKPKAVLVKETVEVTDADMAGRIEDEPC